MDMYALTADTATRLGQLLDAGGTRGRPATANGWGTAAIVRCGAADPALPGKHLGELLWDGGGGWQAAASGVVRLADLDGLALTPGAVYLAVGGGLAGDTPVFRTTQRPAAGCGPPKIFRAQVGTSVTTAVVSGTTVVTAVTAKYRDVTVGADGCISLGSPYCLAADASCSPSESLAYWCIGGVCHAVYDDITPAGGTGPHATLAACSADCPQPPGGAMASGCCVGQTLPATLKLTLSGGNGTVNLVWNGTAWISASVTLPCGVTVIFLFGTGCTLTWSTDGGETFAGTPGGTPTCGPPFSWSVTNIALGGGCGTLTGTLAP